MTKYLTPIIDRKIFFDNPKISGGKISPDGKYITFMKPNNGIRNVWIKEKEEHFDAAKPLTADQNRPIGGYFWSRDSKYILYVQDKNGDENFRVYSVNPNDKANAETGVPDAVDLTPYEGVTAKIYKLPKSNQSEIIVGINDRDKSWHDIYKINIETGERRLMLQNEIQFNSVCFDLKDELKILTKTDKYGGQEFLKLKGSEWKVFYTCTASENASPYSFTKDGRLYMVSDKGNDKDLSELLLMDIDTDVVEFVESDPEGKVDFGGVIFSDLTDTLIGTSYTADKTKIYWKDKDFESDYNLLVNRFDGAEISFTSGTQDEQVWIVFVNKDTDPGSAYLFDRKSKQTTFLYRPRTELPIEHLCEMTPLDFLSSDELKITGYLTLPKTEDKSELPFVIMPHGGPWTRDHWGYNSYAQFLANRGYGVLMINFRGSMGFGKSFLNKGNLQWGKLMQDDITWGVKHVVENGWADETRIAILGGSYGGYATLAGLTFTPDVYAAGVSIVGPSNLFTLLASIPAYWASALKLFHIRMGDPNTEKGKAHLKATSPFFHAHKIKSPLLVAQGDNDPRVKTAESNQIVAACINSGQDVQYLNFPDEGHGLANPNNSMAFLAVTEKFLAKHIGGRFQEEVSDQLKSIIEKVSVDVSTVKI
ncbi:MAG: alpha/beta fold hydrolase [Saprospiraceae bacterium]